jgi:hypothetical protein
MYFQPYGPFFLNGLDGTSKPHYWTGRSIFWARVDKSNPGLPEAIGCFVLATKSKKYGLTPWYVGRTCRGSFRKEVFEQHKIPLIKRLLRSRKPQEVAVFLLAYRRPRGGFKKSTRRLAEVDVLEKGLIEAAYRRNPDLENVRYTEYFHRLVVPGWLNSGRQSGSSATRALAELLGGQIKGGTIRANDRWHRKQRRVRLSRSRMSGSC